MPDTRTEIPSDEDIAAAHAASEQKLRAMREELRTLRAVTGGKTPPEILPTTILADGPQAIRQQVAILSRAVERLIEREASSLQAVLERLDKAPPPGAHPPPAPPPPLPPVDPHLLAYQREEIARIKSRAVLVKWPTVMFHIALLAVLFVCNFVQMALMILHLRLVAPDEEAAAAKARQSPVTVPAPAPRPEPPSPYYTPRRP